jgi:hypothetical protein
MPNLNNLKKLKILKKLHETIPNEPKQHITSYKLTTQLMLVMRGTRLSGAVVLRVTVDLGVK